LLWQIAGLLGTDLTQLIPRSEELLAPASQVRLDKEMMKQIEEAANGDPVTVKVLTGLVGKLKATIDTPRSSRKPHEQRKSRS
jgi:hypothetical protein